MGFVEWFTNRFQSGDSIQLVFIIYVIVVILCGLLAYSGYDSVCAFPIITGTSDQLWDEYVTTFRGRNYFAVSDPVVRDNLQRMVESCPVTIWGIGHFATYLILGFCVPELWWLVFIMGTVWELTESLCGCQCAMDLVWNGLGLVAGIAVRSLLFGF